MNQARPPVPTFNMQPVCFLIGISIGSGPRPHLKKPRRRDVPECQTPPTSIDSQDGITSDAKQAFAISGSSHPREAARAAFHLLFQ